MSRSKKYYGDVECGGGFFGWNTQQELDLFKKWGYSGTIPGQKNSSANILAEEGEKSTMRQLGANSINEYYVLRRNWKKEAYNVNAINTLRQQLGLKAILTSSYHCSVCGVLNDPFSSAQWKSLLNDNVCLDCETGGK